MTRDWNWLLETGSRKLLSKSDRKKMSRYNFHTNWMSICPSLSDLSMCTVVLSNIPRLGCDNSRNLTTTKETKGERESWSWRGLRIKCLLKGRRDQYRRVARKTLNLRSGTLVLFGDRGKFKGWLWPGASGRGPGVTWQQGMWTMSCQWLMGTGCESQGARMGPSGDNLITETRHRVMS